MASAFGIHRSTVEGLSEGQQSESPLLATLALNRLRFVYSGQHWFTPSVPWYDLNFFLSNDCLSLVWYISHLSWWCSRLRECIATPSNNPSFFFQFYRNMDILVLLNWPRSAILTQWFQPFYLAPFHPLKYLRQDRYLHGTYTCAHPR